jgi:hypothetical protein
LGMQLKMGGKFHLKLNIGARPIANKYREGKMKRTLKRELKVREIVEMETLETSAAPGLISLCHPCKQWGRGCTLSRHASQRRFALREKKLRRTWLRPSGRSVIAPDRNIARRSGELLAVLFLRAVVPAAGGSADCVQSVLLFSAPIAAARF